MFLPLTRSLSPRGKLAVVLVVLAAAIILPFVVWGEQIERLAPSLLGSGDTALLVAAVGIALLTVDLALPIPSSVVSISLCLFLGPLLGGAAIVLGMMGGFASGYVLGRMLSRESLRQWVGPELWDDLGRKAARSAPVWIMVSRPVPVLAEATAVITGSLGVPFRTAMLAALLSSLAVAGCYATAVMIGYSEGGFGLAFLSSLVLAGLLWTLSRILRRRVHA
ncbi:MAG: VTT domain-containing protein [Thiobacillus sp.]|nr:VTT domain-containing protein [Thiobacillus sp.]